MKAEPNSFQIDPSGPRPIPPGFRVFLGGSKHGQMETVFFSKDSLNWMPPVEYVYANTYSQNLNGSRGDYRLNWRLHATADRLRGLTSEAVQELVKKEGVEWVLSAEDWLKERGM